MKPTIPNCSWFFRGVRSKRLRGISLISARSLARLCSPLACLAPGRRPSIAGSVPVQNRRSSRRCPDRTSNSTWSTFQTTTAPFSPRGRVHLFIRSSEFKNRHLPVQPTQPVFFFLSVNHTASAHATHSEHCAKSDNDRRFTRPWKLFSCGTRSTSPTSITCTRSPSENLHRRPSTHLLARIHPLLTAQLCSSHLGNSYQQADSLAKQLQATTRPRSETRSPANTYLLQLGEVDLKRRGPWFCAKSRA